jgi:SAM-dependent MidA family methyltransferase
VAALRDEITAAPGGRITFARFMQRALTEPGLGYYATSASRPTREGDFLSAPELHPFFGRCIGRFVEGAWQAADSPADYLVREWGGGRGRLRETALAGLVSDGSPLAGRVRWEIVDLPDRGDTSDSPADLVLANEYLDALPVHRLVREGGQLREAWVSWQQDRFVEVLGELSSEELAAHLEADGVELGEGQRADVSLAAPRALAEMAATLVRGGRLLVIDYGHDASDLYGPSRMAGSLLTYRSHDVADDPFAAVGRTDITAHVDLTALERAAAIAGLVLEGRTTQARFLVDLGLGQLLSDLGRDPRTDVAAYVEARASVGRLLDPRHLGGFAVLAWRRPTRSDAGTGGGLSAVGGAVGAAIAGAIGAAGPVEAVAMAGGGAKAGLGHSDPGQRASLPGLRTA